MDFKDYCREKQHSPYCSRAEAFKLGQQSKQAEIDVLKAKVNDALEAFNDGSFNYCQRQLEGLLK